MRSFKRILKSVISFFLLVGLVSAMFSVFYLRTEYYYYQDAKERGDLSGSLDTFYCGASFALRAFRPDLIDPLLGTNGYNLSGSRLTMLGRKTLLRKEVWRNPVKTVVLEVSCDTLTRIRAQEGPEGELLTFARLTKKERPSYLFKAFRKSEWPLLYYDMVSKGIDDVCSLLSGRLRMGNWFLIRGYYPYHEPNVPFSMNYKALTHSNTLPTQMRQDNINELNQITTLCQNSGIELILVNVPQSKAFNVTYDNLDYFHEWYADYAEKNGLKYYNFNLYKGIDTQLRDDNSFYDMHHLNNDGAIAFSELYAEVMRRAQAGEDLQNEFYSSYAEMLADPAYLAG